MYYASFGILSLIIHIIINHDILRKSSGAEALPVRSRYRYFLYGVMLYYVSDILWGFLYESKIVALAYADTVLYFFSMVLSVLLWTRFVVSYLDRETAFTKILIYSGWIIFTYELLTLLVNFFLPIVFEFTQDGEYNPEPARYITLAVQTLLFFVMAVYSFAVSTKTEGKDRLHHRAICASGLAMTVFIVLQTAFPFLPFYAIGCLIATCLMHAFVMEDEKNELGRELGSAKKMAYTDPLTGVKNKHAYLESKALIEKNIKEGFPEEFGVAVFDLNGLKKINDTLGHDEGDVYIKNACALICQQFKHSPVFRVGGDEFVALLENDDYNDREELFESFDKQVEQNVAEGKVVVSGAFDIFVPGLDKSFDEVFERADHKMYERKKALKAMPASNS